MDLSNNRQEFWQNVFEGFYKTNTNQAKDCRKFLAKQINGNQIKSVLELGCNSGGNLLYIQKENPLIKTVGLDICEEAIRFGKDVEKNSAEFHVGSIYDLSRFEDKSVDLVFTATVLIHLPSEKIPSIIKEMTRIAKRHILNIEDFREQEGVYWEREGIPHRFITNYKAAYEQAGVTFNYRLMKDIFKGIHFGGGNHYMYADLGVGDKFKIL